MQLLVGGERQIIMLSTIVVPAQFGLAVRVAFGAALLLLAWRWAALTGRFFLATAGLHAPSEASIAYLRHPILGYYAPVFALTIAVALLLPHWLLSLAAVLSVPYSFKVGMRIKVLEAILLQTKFIMDEDHLPREVAFEQAHQTIARILGKQSLRVRSLDNVISYLRWDLDRGERRD